MWKPMINFHQQSKIALLHHGTLFWAVPRRKMSNRLKSAFVVCSQTPFISWYDMAAHLHFALLQKKGNECRQLMRMKYLKNWSMAV